MIALFAERYLAVDTITHTFLCLIKADHIIQQAVIGHNIVVLRIDKEIRDSKEFCLIVLRFVQQKLVQVTFGTLERCKICLGCQHPYGNVGKVHLNKGQSGELRLNISYACRALSFSSGEAGDG
jgi:hypothetical protein